MANKARHPYLSKIYPVQVQLTLGNFVVCYWRYEPSSAAGWLWNFVGPLLALVAGARGVSADHLAAFDTVPVVGNGR